jgi:serine protease Do
MRELLRAVKLLLIGLTLVSIGVIAGLLLSTSLPEGRPESAVSVASPGDGPEAGLEVPRALVNFPPAEGEPLTSPFVDVARKVVPAVVSVETRRKITHPRIDGPGNDLFRRLFPDNKDKDEGESDEQIEIPSSGSGFIIDPAGYVFTNDHVIEGSNEMTLHLADGRTYAAWLVGRDPGTDVAVLKIDLPAGDPALPVVPLGNSDEIRVGDWAIAIGNPLGELEGTLTVGIVSAKGRKDLRIAGGGPTYQDFIQTDASINFGNSGGPLVNGRGEVIGINSAVNPTGQGLGFTIPINMAREVAIELIRNGTIRRGFLGILPQEITEDIRQAFDLPASGGILVGNVQTETPAEDGGLEAGDVIVDFNGEPVSNVAEFRALVAKAGVGVDVPIRLLRKGEPKSVHVVLAERPDTPEPPDRRVRERDALWLGATFNDISIPLAKEYDLDRDSGVVVTKVRGGSQASMGGLREGDVVLEVNRTRVGSKGDMDTALNRARDDGKPAVLLIEREGTTSFVTIRLES